MNEQAFFLQDKLIVFSIGLILFILIILPLSLTFFIKVIPSGIQPPLRNTKKIYGEIVLSQAFVSLEDNLAGIGVSIKNPNFANKKKVTMNLSDDQNKILRTINLNGQNIADGKFVKIIFEPVRNSRSKEFIWSIFSYESNFDDALEIFLTDKQPLWSLELRENDKIAEQTLSYVTLHRPSNKTQVLSKVVNGWFERIKGDSIFLVSYIVLILGLLISIFAKSLLRNLKKSF